jgi:hypothetical protein
MMSFGVLGLLFVIPVGLISLAVPFFILYLLFKIHSQNVDLTRRVEYLEQIYNKDN